MNNSEALMNLVQLALNQNMYLSLKAGGNSPELASGVPFFGQMARRANLDLSELLGAGSWSRHPSPGLPRQAGLVRLSQSEGSGPVPVSSAAGLQGLQPHTRPWCPRAALPQHLLW